MPENLSTKIKMLNAAVDYIIEKGEKLETILADEKIYKSVFVGVAGIALFAFDQLSGRGSLMNNLISAAAAALVVKSPLFRRKSRNFFEMYSGEVERNFGILAAAIDQGDLAVWKDPYDSGFLIESDITGFKGYRITDPSPIFPSPKIMMLEEKTRKIGKFKAIGWTVGG